MVKITKDVDSVEKLCKKLETTVKDSKKVSKRDLTGLKNSVKLLREMITKLESGRNEPLEITKKGPKSITLKTAEYLEIARKELGTNVESILLTDSGIPVAKSRLKGDLKENIYHQAHLSVKFSDNDKPQIIGVVKSMYLTMDPSNSSISGLYVFKNKDQIREEISGLIKAAKSRIKDAEPEDSVEHINTQHPTI